MERPHPHHDHGHAHVGHHPMSTGGERQLHVLVQEGPRELCRVAMPTRAVDNLSDFFPDVDRETMVRLGIDLPEISRRVAGSGYAPQVVLEADSGQRQYRVWIG